MPTLFAMHLGRHVRGMVKGPVKAAPAAYAGHLCAETKDIVKPDPDAVRACLPACYRKAWDRSGGTFWYGAGRTPHLTLRNSRGKFLNTLYAIPYVFNSSFSGE